MSTSQTIQEIDAMKSIAEALEPLENEGRSRVLDWASSHFEVSRITQQPIMPQAITQEVIEAETLDNNAEQNKEFSDIADYYHAASPSSDLEKTLVSATWFQEYESIEGIDSQRVNTALKQLGYGVGNITRAFDSLIKTKPALIIQLRKAGSTKQARKTYRVTDAGKKRVLSMIEGSFEG